MKTPAPLTDDTEVELTPDQWAELAAAEAQVSEGLVVPFEDVRAWVASWDTPDELPMP